MKLMGIARFIICDERSEDDVHLLQASRSDMSPTPAAPNQPFHELLPALTYLSYLHDFNPQSQISTGALEPHVNPNAVLLQELYESRGRTYVTVIPSPEPGTLMDGQIACYNVCFEMARNDTDWFIVIVRTPHEIRMPLAAPRVHGHAIPTSPSILQRLPGTHSEFCAYTAHHLLLP